MKRLYSTIFGQTVLVDTARREVITDDGVIYTRDELKVLKGAPAALVVAVHAAKRIFQGTVISGDVPATDPPPLPKPPAVREEGIS